MVDCLNYTARTTVHFETTSVDQTKSDGVVVVPRSRWGGRPVFRDWTGSLCFRTPVSMRTTIPVPDGGDNAVVNARADDVVLHPHTWYADSDYRYPLECGT